MAELDLPAGGPAVFLGQQRDRGILQRIVLGRALAPVALLRRCRAPTRAELGEKIDDREVRSSASGVKRGKLRRRSIASSKRMARVILPSEALTESPPQPPSAAAT
jgi:hypothetical protein